MLMLTSNANIIFVDVICFSSSYTAQVDLQYVLNEVSVVEEQELWFKVFYLIWFCVGIDKGGVC